MCTTKIFGNDDEQETDCLDTIEVIEDDYNGYNPIIINDEEMNEDEVTVNNDNTGEVTQSDTSSTERCVPKMALNNVFILGVDKMNKLNIPKQGKKKKDILKRTNAFFPSNTRNSRICGK